MIDFGLPLPSTSTLRFFTLTFVALFLENKENILRGSSFLRVKRVFFDIVPIVHIFGKVALPVGDPVLQLFIGGILEVGLQLLGLALFFFGQCFPRRMALEDEFRARQLFQKVVS